MMDFKEWATLAALFAAGWYLEPAMSFKTTMFCLVAYAIFGKFYMPMLIKHELTKLGVSQVRT